jgi:hypothetical protein
MLWLWHPVYPLAVDTTRFLSLQVGAEHLIPVSGPDESGAARYALEGQAAGRTPIVRWDAHTLLNRVTSEIISTHEACLRLDTTWKSSRHTEACSSLLAGQGIGCVAERSSSASSAPGTWSALATTGGLRRCRL